MNKKMIAREWLIFLATCVAYFVLAFIASFFGISFIALVTLWLWGIPLLYMLVCAARLTGWALRQVRSRS
jgi:predicted signal transduction protein with EAL and GGDEF domain